MNLVSVTQPFQHKPTLRHAFILALAFASAARFVGAQATLSVAAEARARPGGPLIASLLPGMRVTTGGESGGDTQVTFEGWVDANRLGARRDSFPASVAGRLTLRVRSSPSPRGQVIGILQPGAGLHTLDRQGTWVRVRRTAWLASTAVPGRGVGAAASSTSASAAPAPQAAPPVQGPAARGGNAYVASSGARFRDLPVGRTIGGLTAGSTVEIIARQSGWVRVRADGWVPESEVVGRDSTVRPEVSAADLRADPRGMRGRIVQWEVEVMSLQIADPLRVELVRDEPYLLARGPGVENAILYLAVPQSLLTEARALPPLAKVHVTARVRSARSEPAGTPVLDILSIGKR